MFDDLCNPSPRVEGGAAPDRGEPSRVRQFVRRSNAVHAHLAHRRWQAVANLACSNVRWTADLDEAGLRRRFERARLSSQPSDRDVAGLLAAASVARARATGEAVNGEEMLAAVSMLGRGVPLIVSPEIRARVTALAAVVAAGLGRTVHVIAADETRAAALGRAAEPLFSSLRIGCGVTRSGQSALTRSKQYANPATFGAIHHIGTDYLRQACSSEGMLSEGRLRVDALCGSLSRFGQGGFIKTDFALVDGIDLLLGEGGAARMSVAPNVQDSNSILVVQARGLAGQLRDVHDYDIDTGVLTEAGRERLELLGGMVGPPWTELKPDQQLRMLRYASRAARLAGSNKQDHEDFCERDAAEGDQNIADDLPKFGHFTEAESGGTNCEGSRTGSSAVQISVQRFCRKYRRIAGAAALVDVALPEMHRRYGLVPSRLVEPAGARLSVARDEGDVTRKLQVQVQAALKRGQPALVVTASQARVARVAAQLVSARLPVVELRGAVVPEDAQLILGALRGPAQVIVVSAGRDWHSFARSVPPDHPQPYVVAVGFEEALVTPGRLLETIPPALLAERAEAIIRADSALFASFPATRALLGHISRHEGSWARLWTDRLLSRVLRRMARMRARNRSALASAEEQALSGLAFAGAVSTRL